MSPRTGRPPIENPKRNETRIRMTDGEVERLNYCCEVFNQTKTEVIKRGVDKMYAEAKAQTEHK